MGARIFHWVEFGFLMAKKVFFGLKKRQNRLLNITKAHYLMG